MTKSSRRKNRDPEYLKALGANLRKLRKDQGFSQMRLAFESDLWLSSIGRVERGEIDPTASTLRVIAGALSIPPSKLLDFEYPEKE